MVPKDSINKLRLADCAPRFAGVLVVAQTVLLLPYSVIVLRTVLNGCNCNTFLCVLSAMNP